MSASSALVEEVKAARVRCGVLRVRIALPAPGTDARCMCAALRRRTMLLPDDMRRRRQPMPTL